MRRQERRRLSSSRSRTYYVKQLVPLSAKRKSVENKCRVKQLSIITEIKHSAAFRRAPPPTLRVSREGQRMLKRVICTLESIIPSISLSLSLSSSTGMDSNSQTSQELLIPNDVRRRNSSLCGANLSILPGEKREREKTGNGC